MSQLLVYGLMALALAGTVGAGVHYVKQWGGNEVRAELQPKLDEATAAIEKQNAAIRATKEDGDRRVAAAAQGVARAVQTTRAAQTEAERLRGLQGAPTPAGTCSAGAAVAELRRGLK